MDLEEHTLESAGDRCEECGAALTGHSRGAWRAVEHAVDENPSPSQIHHPDTRQEEATDTATVVVRGVTNLLY